MDVSRLNELPGVAAAPPDLDVDELRDVELEGDEADSLRQAGWRFVAPDPDVPGLRAVCQGPTGRLSIEGASVVVRFDDEAPRELVDDVIDRHQLVVQRQMGFVPQGFKLTRRDAPHRGDILKLSEELQNLDIVRYADPDFVEVLTGRGGTRS